MQGSSDFETDEVWEFSGSWRKKGQLTKPRGGLGAVYHNRKVLVVGGNGQMYVIVYVFKQSNLDSGSDPAKSLYLTTIGKKVFLLANRSIIFTRIPNFLLLKKTSVTGRSFVTLKSV